MFHWSGLEAVVGQGRAKNTINEDSLGSNASKEVSVRHDLQQNDARRASDR
jgi:hypothetical protein